MNHSRKIVVENYPVDRLPEELRRGIEAGVAVRVTIEGERCETQARPLRTFLGAAPGLYESPEEAVAYIRALRDESDR